MARTFTVTAHWDSEARVFTTQSDILGLVVEAETYEELVGLVEALAPDIIATNLPHVQGPITVKVEASRDLAVVE
ncbi:MAG: DUF1902 domain-containing protein [Hyphomicrobiales bacterium]